MSKPDGGSAYPMGDLVRGVSVRDFFAQTAPVTMAEAEVEWRKTHQTHGLPRREEVFAQMAEMRFTYADAMLAERSKP